MNCCYYILLHIQVVITWRRLSNTVISRAAQPQAACCGRPKGYHSLSIEGHWQKREANAVEVICTKLLWRVGNLLQEVAQLAELCLQSVPTKPATSNNSNKCCDSHSQAACWLCQAFTAPRQLGPDIAAIIAEDVKVAAQV